MSPCQHGYGLTHDSAVAMSLDDPQIVQWFGTSQERDRTHLLGKIYLSAEVRKHIVYFFLIRTTRRKERAKKYSKQKKGNKEQKPIKSRIEA